MNPDGTGQIEYYGSNSYWPNSTFYAKPLPGQTSKFVGIVTGHHGVPRMGELVLFDIGSGRQEDSGAVQRIPGYGKPVEGIIKDQLVNDSWPKFLHPQPIADKYFLVACQPNNKAGWGIYLVDVFDNIVLLREEPGLALLEPIPLKKTPRPADHPGQGQAGSRRSPRWRSRTFTRSAACRMCRAGSVKSLRVYEYVYSYRNMGGHYAIGMEGPWDVRRLLGTVPVQPDGSSYFEIPANTPIAFQPLDAEGKALQLKRSWMVGMPGERVSCMGCHDNQNSGAMAMKPTTAQQQAPAKLKPWYGPTRGFSFLREVQPVLDKYCVGCHDGKEPDRPRFDQTDGRFPEILQRAASLCAAQRSRGRLQHSNAIGVPCRHQRSGADAAQGPPQREARCGGVGPVDHLDRPERAGPGDMARGGQNPGEFRATPPRDGQGIRGRR